VHSAGAVEHEFARGAEEVWQACGFAYNGGALVCTAAVQGAEATEEVSDSACGYQAGQYIGERVEAGA